MHAVGMPVHVSERAARKAHCLVMKEARKRISFLRCLPLLSSIGQQQLGSELAGLSKLGQANNQPALTGTTMLI